jgi:hypothetical protein
MGLFRKLTDATHHRLARLVVALAVVATVAPMTIGSAYASSAYKCVWSNDHLGQICIWVDYTTSGSTRYISDVESWVSLNAGGNYGFSNGYLHMTWIVGNGNFPSGGSYYHLTPSANYAHTVYFSSLSWTRGQCLSAQWLVYLGDMMPGPYTQVCY